MYDDGPRAAFSHSASVGSRKVTSSALPVSQSQKSPACSNDTDSTGCSPFPSGYVPSLQ